MNASIMGALGEDNKSSPWVFVPIVINITRRREVRQV